jgi:iron complex outermembrane receptor protein
VNNPALETILSGRRFAQLIEVASNRTTTALEGWLLLGLSIGLWCGPAFAQSALSAAAKPSPAAATPQAQPSPAGIEEIVVTAQKREQLSQEVPIALSAFTASTIQFRGIQDMSDLQMQVPGMAYAYDDGASQQIFIRGIGVDDVTGDIESPVATYIDGVYQTRDLRAPTLGIDLDRVEVLKGPQGTLFGRNATGGAVNITLLPPSDELTGSAKVGGGSYGQILTQGTVSGPLIKHLLDIRLSGAFEHDDGWIINEINNRPGNDHLEGDGRLALAFHPLDNLSIDYELLANKLVGGGTAGIATNVQMGTPAIQKSAGIPTTIPPSDYINGDNPWKAKFDYPIKGDQENTQNSVTAKWDIARWVSLKSITAFQEHTLGGQVADGDGTAYPIYHANGHDVDDKYISQELNLVGTQDLSSLWKTEQPWTWILGGYYGHEEYANFFPAYYIFDHELTGSAGGREKLNDYSVFADTTIPLPWNFSLFGGVRYTYDKKDLRQTVTLQFGHTYLNIPGTTCNDLDFVDNDHNVSPRVGMSWAPNEMLNFYVKYSEGYNAGGHYYNGCNNGYNPETVDTVEGGVKGRFFDGRLVVDADGYHNDFKDFQIFQVFPTAGAATTRVINAPEAEMYGGEFQITAIPLENVSANVGISLMHSQYERFHDEDLLNPKAGLQDLSGNQMERAPNHTEFVGLEYAWPVPWHSIIGTPNQSYLNFGSLRLRGEWFHTDYIIFRPFGNTGFAGDNDRQNPYSIFNFYATLPTEDGKWSLRFFAKNFTFTKYYSYKTADPWGYVGTGGMPPWFGGDLTYRF